MRTLLPLSLSVLCAACSSSSAPVTPDPLADAGPGDAAGALTVKISSPSSPLATDGKSPVTIQVVVDGSADSVELLRDGTTFAALAFPYQYAWDPTRDAEGSYAFVAKATRGAAVGTSAPLSVTLDRTAPTILARIPAPGAANVAVGSPITVEFSEPMRPESFTDASVSLLDAAGAAIPRTIALSADGKKLSVKASAPIVAPTTARVSFGVGVTDLVGNPLVVPADAWSWTYPEYVTLGVVPIDATSRIGALAGLTVDPSGAPLLAWSEASSTAHADRVARWSASAWSPLGGAAGDPSMLGAVTGLAAGTAPQAFALWSDPSTVLARAWDGATWSAVGGSLRVNTTSSVLGAGIVVDASGAPVVGFAQGSGSPMIAESWVRRWDGAAWQTLGTSPTSVLSSRLWALAPAATGVIGVYEEMGLTSSGALVARQWQGSSWTKLPSLYDTGPYQQVLLTGGAVPTIAYVVSGNRPVVEHLDAGRWSYVAFQCTSCNNGERIALASDATGAPALAVRTYSDVQVTRPSSSLPTPKVSTLTPAAGYYPSQIALTVDGSNRIVLAMLDLKSSASGEGSLRVVQENR
jgi:hypothetical protein